MDTSKELGYILAKLEGIEKRMDSTDSKIEKLREAVSLYSTAIKVSKIGLTVFVALLTLKFGDISALWRS